MQVQEEQQQHDLNHMQMIKLKGKRTKRQRLPSLFTLAMPSTSSTDNSEEEEDMANCLILLAQGRHHHDHHQKQNSSPESYQTTTPDHSNNNNRKKLGLCIYECKTCNRCFPSFQALGGHRASHKKPKTSIAQDQKPGVTSFVNDCFDNYFDSTTTNTTLTLQIPNNRALFSTNPTTRTITKCNKVHECSICGSEFTSGQALGGHMRRHRTVLSTTSTTTFMSGAKNIRVCESPHESIEVKKPRNVLELDLNLPAPDEDHRECKLPFQSKEKVIVLNATSLVDCHY
ncbi:hypothetical protein TanjilG_02610 [Lupinus angustifolius]|uniref:C2H2-type domain-containing protein n=1 Tax=Lupinus angustifolius TaxID=3871 RepID=A0A4P1R8F6_LUPAN|nr:PREDICTED: zinc finger protein ZAT5-like [Lupinus angustifolius]OIW05137.1 hypothetical protein TanjilG_02610 [Lupinus angustifolius]